MAFLCWNCKHELKFTGEEYKRIMEFFKIKSHNHPPELDDNCPECENADIGYLHSRPYGSMCWEHTFECDECDATVEISHYD